MAVKAAGGAVRGALRVIVLSHAASFCVLLGLALRFSGPFPHGALLAWGLGAGVTAGLSLSAFYLALARGAMGASAALSGLLAAAIPAAVSLAREGSPGALHGAGFAVAGVAIWLIAAGPATREQASTLALAVGAGAGFGLYFVALKFANASGVLWPMTTARIGSLTTCGLLLLLLPQGDGAATIGRKALPWILGTALFDTCGNLLFVAATRAGRLDVASVLAALYPASTILLASVLLKERLTRRQCWGMAVATAAVLLITVQWR